MGGRFPDRFPPVMRVAAVAQALVLAAMAGIVLSCAGLALPQWSEVSDSLVWVVVFAAVSTLLNAITLNEAECRIWLPVATVMLASSLTVALAAA